jgi:cyclic nucleotide-binding protein/tetratricopeptide repeat protein
MTKLKELEKRLRDEPENLGLRVMLAGALHEAGRRDDAVELYRSVAIAYREQGRTQQAITVCRSVLEMAPDDASCLGLLAMMLASQAPPEPAAPARLPRAPSPAPLAPPEPGDPDPERRSSSELTPLPSPLPYHVAEPTRPSILTLSRSDLPLALQEELQQWPEIAGIANAARQISASLIAASRQDDDGETHETAVEPDTRRRARITATDLDQVAAPPGPIGRRPAELGDDDPTIPPRSAASRGVDDDDQATAIGAPRGIRTDDAEVTAIGSPQARSSAVHAVVEDEQTSPRDLPARVRPPSIAPPTTATGPLASAFFAPVPPHSRAAVLQRFRRRMAALGTTVIRRGETEHVLVLVVRGQLDVHTERSDGARISLGPVAPGDYVGEVSLLAHAPAAAYVVAATDAELLVLAAPDFYEVTGAFPALRAELTQVAERRARDHEQRLRL